MKGSDLIQAFRSEADDLRKPYLWQDDEILLWLNEACEEAAIRARLIFDNSSKSITQIVVKAGVPTVKLHSSILKLDRVILDGQGQPLMPTFRDCLDHEIPNWEAVTGTPTRYIQDELTLRLVWTPVADGLLRLACFRLPLDQIGPDDEPEFGAQHHRRLVDWALFRAYSKRDSDAYNPQGAQDAETAFTASFGIRPDANVERKQRKRKPTVVRVQF